MKTKIGWMILTVLLCGTLWAQQAEKKSNWQLRREARDEVSWKKEQIKMYNRAIENAREIKPREMVSNLWGVNDPQVTRDADSMVLVVMPVTEAELPQWTGSIRKSAPATIDPSEMWWVSLDPQLAGRLQFEPVMDSASVAVAIKQLLGLSPQVDYPFIVSFWVSPRDLFRPAADPDPTTHTSSALFREDVNPAHKVWMESYEKEAYDGPSPHPWTRLGYAYDWGNAIDPVGVSEFIVTPNTSVRIHSLGSIWNWYSINVDTDNPRTLQNIILRLSD